MSSTNDTKMIVIKFLVPNVDTLKIDSSSAYLVDDLTIRSSEVSLISPLFRHLFALWHEERKRYLAPHETLGGDSEMHNLTLKIRFHPGSHELLMTSLPTLDYYYYQMRHYLMNSYQPGQQNSQVKNRIIGLLVTDYVRKLIETNRDASVIEKDFDDFVDECFPPKWNMSWWKKLYLKSEFQQGVIKCFQNSKSNVLFLKDGYMREFCSLVPDFMEEQYQVDILYHGAVYSCQLIVNPHSVHNPGVKVVHDKRSLLAFTICQLCYINNDDNMLEVHVRNEQPINISFHDLRKRNEFMTLLDGYYRLTEKFMACLCSSVQSPTVVYLRKNKIHAPISPIVSHRKLLENSSTRKGCYIIRQSRTHYRKFLCDFVNPETATIETKTIVENFDGNFRLEEDTDESAYQTISSLVENRIRSSSGNCCAQYQIPPSEYDRTDLQLCKATSTKDLLPQFEKSLVTVTAPVILLRRNLKLEKGIYSSKFHKLAEGRINDEQVIVRSLVSEQHVTDFLEKAEQVLQWKSREIVPVLGLIISSPVSLVLKSMPLGPLDRYLKDKCDELSIGDLGDAALCIAKAVWYLEEQGFVHGKIRCKKALVAEHVRSSFKVKLGDPGLLVYKEDDVHWIAPEYLSVMDSVAYSQKADTYALGTCIWEIFNKGKDPSDIIGLPQARQFYATGGRLSLAEVPQEFCAIVSDCWNSDPDQRRQPHSIVRDIHQLLYQIYQPKKYNCYADLDTSKISNITKNSPEAPELPPLRTVPSSLPGLTRRHSTASNTSIASRKGWKSLFWPKQKEYDALSNVTSISCAQSERTVTTEVPDVSDLNITPTNDELEVDISTEVEDNEIDDESWIIDRKDLRLGNPLGQGFFGMVFKATLVRYAGILEEPVAVKRMKSSVAEFSHKDLEREIDIMKTLRHENIVEIKGIVEEPEILLVMEFLELGSLQSYLQCNKDRLPHSQLIKYSYDIANAMAYLEQKNIIHRDLAARNILVKSVDCVKISDFGLAHIVNKDYYMIQTMHRNLPIKWYAPESILYGKFSAKSDVWSYGVALWEMFTFGEDPMINECSNLAKLGERLVAGFRLPCPERCPADVYQLMRDCWRSDHHLRPTFASLLKTTKLMYETTG